MFSKINRILTKFFFKYKKNAKIIFKILFEFFFAKNFFYKSFFLQIFFLGTFFLQNFFWRKFFFSLFLFCVIWLVVTTRPPVVLFGKERVTNLSKIQIVKFISNIHSNAQICILILWKSNVKNFITNHANEIARI